MSFVLDASVALAWCFSDERSARSLDVLERLNGEDAIVAPHWAFEIANGLLSAERRGRIRAAEARRFMGLLNSLPITPEAVARRGDLESSHSMGRVRSLTSYDAAYLELAVRTALPLATLDDALSAAARAEGVELLLESD